MKRCKKCGTELNKKEKFCTKCGKKQENTVFKTLRMTLGIILLFVAAYWFWTDVISFTSSENNTEEKKDDSCYATMEKFNNIQNGMSYQEVIDVVGCEGTLQTESGFGETTMKVYYWYAKNGISNMTISIYDEKVSAKAQLGLDK